MPFKIFKDAFDSQKLSDMEKETLIKQIERKYAGPAAGDIYVSPDKTHAYEFHKERASLKRLVPAAAGAGDDITDTNQWGKKGITQVEYEYSFSDFIHSDADEKDGTALAVYYGYQKPIDYIKRDGEDSIGSISEIGFKKVNVGFDGNGETISITFQENTITGLVNGVQTTLNPDTALTYMKQPVGLKSTPAPTPAPTPFGSAAKNALPLLVQQSNTQSRPMVIWYDAIDGATGQITDSLPSIMVDVQFNDAYGVYYDASGNVKANHLHDHRPPWNGFYYIVSDQTDGTIYHTWTAFGGPNAEGGGGAHDHLDLYTFPDSLLSTDGSTSLSWSLLLDNNDRTVLSEHFQIIVPDNEETWTQYQNVLTDTFQLHWNYKGKTWKVRFSPTHFYVFTGTDTLGNPKITLFAKVTNVFITAKDHTVRHPLFPEGTSRFTRINTDDIIFTGSRYYDATHTSNQH